MKKIIKLTEKDIQKLVTKIIRENVDDEFSWVNDLDANMGEKQYKKKWGNIESDWGVDMDDTFELLVNNGITKLNVLNDIAGELYDQFSRAWDGGRNDCDCDCDGCCDDYIWYDDHLERLDTAREEGRDEGRDSRDGEVSDLEDEIADLQEKLNDRDTEVEEMEEEIVDLKEKLSRLLTGGKEE